jgi:DNA modification methylase
VSGRVIVLRGDAAHLPLPDGSVDLVCTSPPYWGVRDYRDGGESLAGQIGSEERWQDYLANLLRCTAEWTRVLKPEGSIFVNLSDKYANDAKWGGATSGKHVNGLHGKTGIGRAKVKTGIPPKSLIGLPSRYAIACVDELGLTWRRDNIWFKPSAMPESVDDRCATKHEYVQHLTLQPDYYAAIDEIREHSTSQSPKHDAKRRQRPTDSRLDLIGGGRTSTMNTLGKLPGSVWEIAFTPLNVPERLEHGRCCGGRKRDGCQDGLDHHAAFPLDLVRKVILGWSPSGICLECGEGRFPVAEQVRRVPNDKLSLATRARTVTATGTHVGSTLGYPAATAERQIIGYACACTPYTDHPGSGKPTQGRDYNPGPEGYNPQGTYGRKQAGEYERVGPWREYHLERWTPPPTRPAVVLDPFGGTGTTALVASVLGRIGITSDRSRDYCGLAVWRTSDPGERARALGVPKPPPVMDGQDSLFDFDGSAA